MRASSSTDQEVRQHGGVPTKNEENRIRGHGLCVKKLL